MVIEYRITFESSDVEFVTVTASNLSTAIRDALVAARRYDRRTGKRDHVISIEFWNRLS